MKSWFSAALCAFLLISTFASAQAGLLDAGVAYSHKTGGGPANGFVGGGELGLAKYVRLVGEISPYWGGTTVTTIKTNSNEQDYMFGGRFPIPNAFRNPKLEPYGQLLYGVARQAITVKNVNGPDISSDSSTAWAWDLGGGVEYLYRPKWKLRGGISLWKTHFADQSQANAKFGVGIAYCFGSQGCRGPK
jgi:Outer membrane protein beta-barrel domain